MSSVATIVRMHFLSRWTFHSSLELAVTAFRAAVHWVPPVCATVQTGGQLDKDTVPTVGQLMPVGPPFAHGTMSE